MQLSQNNNINLSLTQVKNNTGKTKIWEVVKQNQFNSANRINSNGKDQTSIEIIEKFTEGLDRKSKINLIEKPINSKGNIQKLQKLNISPINAKLNTGTKNNLNIIDNSKINQIAKLNLVKKKQLPLKNNQFINSNQQKNISRKQIKTDPSIIIQQNISQKNKPKNKTNNTHFLNIKKITEIQEAGHSEIVFSINNDSSEKKGQNNDNSPELLTEINLKNKKVEKGISKEQFEIPNNNIDINFQDDSSSSSNLNNFQDDFKDTLLHLINHFNTKIKGEIVGDHSGEFEIKTEKGNLSINIKKIKNELTIIINSNLIDNIKDQLKSIEISIKEKMPELESVIILGNLKISDEKKPIFFKCEKEKSKIQLNQNTIFKLNYLI